MSESIVSNFIRYKRIDFGAEARLEQHYPRLTPEQFEEASKAEKARREKRIEEDRKLAVVALAERFVTSNFYSPEDTAKALKNAEVFIKACEQFVEEDDE